MNNQVEISLVIPTYNCQGSVRAKIETAYSFLKDNFNNFELIIVDDGSSDSTFEEIKKISLDNFQTFQLSKNCGKGAAIKKGVLESTGKSICYTDIDLPFNLEFINYSHQLISEQGFHLVAGDRTLPGSNYYQQLSHSRMLGTKVFSTATRIVITGEMFDTQCGFKSISGDIARDIFSMLKTQGFAFDVELLYIALKYNLAIRKVPVRFRASDTSSVNLIAQAIPMLKDIARLPVNWKDGKYHSKTLKDISSQRYWENGAKKVRD